MVYVVVVERVLSGVRAELRRPSGSGWSVESPVVVEVVDLDARRGAVSSVAPKVPERKLECVQEEGVARRRAAKLHLLLGRGCGRRDYAPEHRPRRGIAIRNVTPRSPWRCAALCALPAPVPSDGCAGRGAAGREV